MQVLQTFPPAKQTVIVKGSGSSASAAATNLALDTFNAPDDPAYRVVVDLRGLTKVRLFGRMSGTLVAATKIRIRYHPGGDPTVSTADGSWATLMDTAGSHTASTDFYSAAADVPAAAQINDCVIQAGLFSGDGAADPTLAKVVLSFYAG